MHPPEADGKISSYAYDVVSRLVKKTSPKGEVTVYDYDACGLVISRQDARGKQTTYAYDSAGRMTAVSYPATPALNVAYAYDGSAAGPNGIGHVTHVQDAIGTTDFTYDAVGRVASETRTIGGASVAVGYAWDGGGRLTGLALPQGTVGYSYDALGRPTAVSVVAAGGGSSIPVVSRIGYLPFGPMGEIDYANGVVRSETRDLEYKPDGLSLTAGATTLMQRSFSFGDHLNLRGIDDDAADRTKSQVLGYDDAQRLASASSGTYGSLGWTYDKVGNRLTEARTPAGSSAGTTSTFNYPMTSNLLTSITPGLHDHVGLHLTG